MKTNELSYHTMTAMDAFLTDLLTNHQVISYSVSLVEDNAKLCGGRWARGSSSAASPPSVPQLPNKYPSRNLCRWSSCDSPILESSKAVTNRFWVEPEHDMDLDSVIDLYHSPCLQSDGLPPQGVHGKQDVSTCSAPPRRPVRVPSFRGIR